MVAVSGQVSYAAKVTSGVPQGTVLGPLLFLLYINDMEDCVKHSTVRHFADDTRLLKEITSQEDIKLLQEDLINVSTWSRKNNMELHEKKFELLSYSTRKHSLLLSELPYNTQFWEYNSPGGFPIEPKESCRDLGIKITNQLDWSPHITSICQGGKKMASWVLSVFESRTHGVMLTLYKSMVRSKLENSCPLWSPSKTSYSSRRSNAPSHQESQAQQI